MGNIDWAAVRKKGFQYWDRTLRVKTLELLKSEPRLPLDRFNEIGCYHRIPDREIFEQMQQQYGAEGIVNESWMSKDIWPGIATALFNPHNTYSIARGNIDIVRFYFNPGFFLYDPAEDQQWTSWQGKDEENPWSKQMNDRGASLEDRMRFVDLPFHANFYRNNQFGAAIGHFDYISVVIVLPEAVKKVEFLKGIQPA